MKGDPQNPLAWLAVARKDLNAFETLSSAGDTHMAAFCLQQAAEKALKGWLIGRGWSLIKTHSLGLLVGECLNRGVHIDFFTPVAERLTDLYFTDRYVDIAPDPEPTQEELLNMHREVVALISKLFPDNPS